MNALLSLEEARRDVRARAEALGDAELALENAPGCPIWVHPKHVEGCKRCQAIVTAGAMAWKAELALEAAQRRLEAVESQIPEVQWIGGER